MRFLKTKFLDWDVENSKKLENSYDCEKIYGNRQILQNL
jgi:hypothetical protein